MYSLCAYSTSNNAYAPKAAASLLTIREHAPDVNLYLIGRHFSWSTKRLLKSHAITPIEINLHKVFTKEWDYPIECYYIFAGPEIFQRLQFSHSLYIDGDIVCNRDPRIDLSQVNCFAGVENGEIANILGADRQLVLNRWPSAVLNQNRIQTGVMYFNNERLADSNFLENIGSLFRDSIDIGAPRKGDDSLFALYQAVDTSMSYVFLPREYNYIENAQLSGSAAVNDSVVFYHFTGRSPKPWSLVTRFPSESSQHFYALWGSLLRKNFTDKEISKHFSDLKGR